MEVLFLFVRRVLCSNHGLLISNSTPIFVRSNDERVIVSKIARRNSRRARIGLLKNDKMKFGLATKRCTFKCEASWKISRRIINELFYLIKMSSHIYFFSNFIILHSRKKTHTQTIRKKNNLTFSVSQVHQKN